MKLRKSFETFWGTVEILLSKSLVFLAAVVCGIGYFCCCVFLGLLAKVFCGGGVEGVLTKILAGQLSFFHVVFYVLIFLVCSVLVTLFCGYFAQKIFKDRTDQVFSETRGVGTFILGVCTVLGLLYDTFPGVDDNFRRKYLVLSLIVMMMNCSMVVLNEFRKAYREYKRHEIRIDSGESNFEKFMKKFRGSKDKTTDSSGKQ